MGYQMPANNNNSKNPSTFTLDAVPEKFAAAQENVRAFLSRIPCSARTLLELDMLVEEVFINIANYAYPGGRGNVAVDLSLNENGDTLCMTFRDTGVPYDPLKKKSPDLTAPAEMRAIGGLGIFLVQKYSNAVSYEYSGNENRLTICKKLS